MTLAGVEAQPRRPTVAIFDLRGTQRPRTGGGGPLAVICGLPVVVRSLLVLERQGFEHAVLLAHPNDSAALAAELGRHPRLRLKRVIWEDGGELLAPAAQALAGLPGNAVALYWPATLSFGRLAPILPSLDDGAELQVVAPDLLGAENQPSKVRLLVISRLALQAHGALSALGLMALQNERGRSWREPAPEDLTVLTVAREPIEIVDARTARRAEAALLQSLRKDVDGVVARIDRNVSLAISRRLMALPVTPNQVTVMAGVLGVLCGLLVGHGGYQAMLLGALGFQLNSILDGVDGEIARAKLLESRAGQWFDTLADDLTNLAFMVGAAVGCYRTWGSTLYLVLGAVGAIGFLIATTLMYHYLVTRAHSGDLNDFALPWEEGANGKRELGRAAHGPVSRFIARIKWLARRDAYVFGSVLCALVGQLRIMVWLFAAGTTVTWVTIMTYRSLVPLRRRRAKQSS